jgi:hypothetical protein
MSGSSPLVPFFLSSSPATEMNGTAHRMSAAIEAAACKGTGDEAPEGHGAQQMNGFGHGRAEVTTQSRRQQGHRCGGGLASTARLIQGAALAWGQASSRSRRGNPPKRVSASTGVPPISHRQVHARRRGAVSPQTHGDAAG